ncbi:MAG: tRNA pseudouridine(38-40) synthase TruA [Actinomycetota bacterium]|nr:tRNA pseudouridine(38-40) synthase TruA [Actinomycetota bacterium]
MAEERRFALKLEYDGTAYGGSQFQLNAKTVQEELEKALEPLAGRPQRAALAGRTDAGVHAMGQVAAVAAPARWTPADLQRALNARLPGDISVVAAMMVSAGFDPRRCAIGRRYQYRILNAAIRSPLARRTVWYMPHHLDIAAMQRSASLLVGEHDFAAFAGRIDAGLSTVRTMTRADVERDGGIVTLEFEANAFLPHQVRRTVGALVETGRGRISEEGFAALLRQARPGAAGPAAPPQGLSLVEVAYESVRFEMGENG